MSTKLCFSFVIGLSGHPGINVPLEEGLTFEDYYLEFPNASMRRAAFTPACFITGKENPFEVENNRYPLHHRMFDDSAIVLKGVGNGQNRHLTKAAAA